MRARLTVGLSHEELRAALPKPLRERLWPSENRTYALLQFRVGREDVVLSREVAAALKRLSIPPEHTLVATAGTFTIEAVELLAAQGAITLTRFDFSWTDERYTQIRENK